MQTFAKDITLKRLSEPEDVAAAVSLPCWTRFKTTLQVKPLSSMVVCNSIKIKKRGWKIIQPLLSSLRFQFPESFFLLVKLIFLQDKKYSPALYSVICPVLIEHKIRNSLDIHFCKGKGISKSSKVIFAASKVAISTVHIFFIFPFFSF